MHSPPPPRKVLIAGWAITGVVVTIGCWLRMAVASGPLWLDELHTAWCIEDGFAAIEARAGIGNQPPLYFWLTWLANHTAAIGLPTQFALRAASLATGATLMLAAAWLVNRWTGSLISGALATALIAIDPNFIFYATEARPYVALQLLSVFQVGFFVEFISALRQNRSSTSKRVSTLVGLITLSVLLFYIHYTSIWLHVTEAFLFLMMATWGTFRMSRTAIFETGVVVLVTTAMIAPAISHLFGIMGQSEYWSNVSNPWSLAQPMVWNIACYFALPVMLGFIIQNLVGRLNQSKHQNEGRREVQPKSESASQPRPAIVVGIVIAWACLPTLLVQAIALAGIAPIALERYTQVAAAAFPIGAAFMLATLISNPKTHCVAAILVLCGITLVQNQFIQQVMIDRSVPPMRFENWREPIAVINADEAKINQPLFLFANILEDQDALTNMNVPFEEYLKFPIQGVYQVNASQRSLVSGPTLGTDAELAQLIGLHRSSIERNRGAWILVRGTRTTVTSIASAFQAHFEDSRIDFFESPQSDVVLISLDIVD